MAEPKKLYLSRKDHMIAGVCGGLAGYLDVDSTVVRVIAVVLLILTGFVPVGLIYLALWILVPEEPVHRSWEPVGGGPPAS